MSSGFGKHWDQVQEDHQKVCREAATLRHERNELRTSLEEALARKNEWHKRFTLVSSEYEEQKSALSSARTALEEAQARITAAVDVLSAPPVLNWQPYATKIRDALAILEGEK